jgi:hypothetical protein
MANESGVEVVGTSADGVTVGKASGKASVYGETPVVQAAAIANVTGEISLTTTINAVLLAIKNFGIIA